MHCLCLLVWVDTTTDTNVPCFRCVCINRDDSLQEMHDTHQNVMQAKDLQIEKLLRDMAGLRKVQSASLF